MKNKYIKAGEFKAKCLQIMDEVESSHTPIIITKRGKPVAKLVPVSELPASLFGCMRGTVKITGDIIAPIDDKWEANE